MRNLLLCLGFCLLVFPMWAQESDSLQTDSVLAPPPPRVINTIASVDIYETDERINDGFASFGDPISDLIFYAPSIGEDVLFGKVGELQMPAEFYDSPPVNLSYTYADKDALDFDKKYTVGQNASGALTLSYEKDINVKPGEAFTINGESYTLVLDGAGEAESNVDTGLPVELTFTGDEGFAGSLAFSTEPLDASADLGALSTLKVTYTQTDILPPSGEVEAAGYAFKIEPNTNSAYKFDGESSYTFLISELTFLPIVVIVLLSGALFFTLYFGFVNFRKFKLAIDVVRGKYTDPTEKGEVSHFQALTAALSGTVGLGNIAGVAIAISIGGAGATFWMVLAGLLGMSSKFVECTLGVKYRTIDANGEVSGGPMYYLSRGLAEKGFTGLGKVFAVFFAIMCIGGSFGGGNMFQVNQAFQQFAGLSFVEGTWIADNGWMFGVIMAAMVAVVIIGGIRSIASVTDKIVPFMCGLYVLAALIIIGLNITEVPRVFGEIFAGAFAPTAIAGGFIGVLIQGFRRAAFSNEAGVGSASIAHSAVKTNNPASEGIVALLEPFIDTVVVCTMTALVIIITNNHLDPSAADGVALTSNAFSAEIPFFKYLLAVAVILFAFSTMITWSYYGLKAWTYLFGGSKVADIAYKVLFCVFVVVGAAASLGSVTDFSDAMIFAMAFPNIIGLIILAPVVKEELSKYLGKIKSGEIIKVS